MQPSKKQVARDCGCGPLLGCKCGKSKKLASHALKNTYNNTGIATGVIIIEWKGVHICLSKWWFYNSHESRNLWNEEDIQFTTPF